MNTRVLLQPAYVIHRRPFRNTSLLVDFFCPEHGRIAAVARGARRGKSRMHGLLQAFQPLRISFSGRGDVKTLTNAESAGAAVPLTGERLFSGFYINELLSRMLHDHVEHPRLYEVYRETLDALANTALLERVLRRFELELLAELGYAVNLESDCREHEPIAEDKFYRYLPDVGFEVAREDENDRKRIFAGAHLLALGRLDLDDPAAAASAKRLLRQALEVHLGGRPLHSRKLFAPSPSSSND
ncbi:MAG: DNA repair protein RecO [Gammaproteobacteria bacterium]|nr:DNA repair protein RecO [Gammaproteobacteria bacterium]MXX07304.1 DNA repair protein RecO [Gammaproteobacteria bacterium]MYA35141.1 DNA repair protein RecO [Gammaproteobacteria bacterium]MYE30808.1 DNA repair protein RecO [Gammaproteobacteria bacterium]MYH85039.1 DNA repair protein RecO [Gammaproteobacteria bacterium]